MKFNRDFKKAPKDGTEVILWISSDKGFPDMTANFYYLPVPRSKDLKKIYRKLGSKSGWKWSESGEPLKRPDLVKGWMIYPQPPKR